MIKTTQSVMLTSIDRPDVSVDSATSPTPAKSKVNVLVVDDVAANRIVLQMFLEQQGYTTDLAENGEQAVQLATENRYDAILMDVQMPGVDGLTATKRIRRAAGPNGQALIFAVTASIGEDTRSKCYAAGMDGHFTKPLDLTKFCRTLDHLIAAHTTAAGRLAAERR